MFAYMTRSYVLFSIWILCTYGQAPCPMSFATFASCMYRRIDASNVSKMIQRSFLNTQVQSKINKCFIDNGCVGPDYDRDPCIDLPQPIRSFVDKVRQEIGTAPLSVEQCLKATLSRSTSECISSTGLSFLISNASSDQIRNTNQVYADMNGFFFGERSDDNPESIANQKKAVYIQVNVASAIRICKENNHNDNAKIQPTLKCLFDVISSDAQRTICQAANYCDGNGAPTDCRRQYRQSLRLLCQCKKQKQIDVLAKLDVLRKKGDVPILDVVTALGNGKTPEDTFNDIRTCFVRNNEPPPPTLSLLGIFIYMQETKQDTDKPGSSQMRADLKTLNVIRDLYDSGDFGDDECTACNI